MAMKDGNNCCVLGTGNAEGDHAHVSRATPLQTKRKELMNDPQYQAAAMDSQREAATRKARQEGHVRPLGGGADKKAI